MFSFLIAYSLTYLINRITLGKHWQLRLSLGSHHFDRTKHHEIEAVVPIAGCYKCYKARNNDLTWN